LRHRPSGSDLSVLLNGLLGVSAYDRLAHSFTDTPIED
jgi:hypothetical protein